MHLPSLIERKRDGGALTAEEIAELVRGYVSGEVPDYQMAALAMAVFFRGMSDAETTALTMEMRDSGEVFAWPAGTPPKVDKHSTGGVGDKVSSPRHDVGHGRFPWRGKPRYPRKAFSRAVEVLVVIGREIRRTLALPRRSGKERRHPAFLAFESRAQALTNQFAQRKPSPLGLTFRRAA